MEPETNKDIIKPTVAKKTINNITNNISVKQNPWTTIIGIIFVLIGLGMIVLSFLITHGLVRTIVTPAEYPSWVAWAILGLGISFLLIPDKIGSALSKIIDRKSDNI